MHATAACSCAVALIGALSAYCALMSLSAVRAGVPALSLLCTHGVHPDAPSALFVAQQARARRALSCMPKACSAAEDYVLRKRVAFPWLIGLWNCTAPTGSSGAHWPAASQPHRSLTCRPADSASAHLSAIQRVTIAFQ